MQRIYLPGLLTQISNTLQLRRSLRSVAQSLKQIVVSHCFSLVFIALCIIFLCESPEVCVPGTMLIFRTRPIMRFDLHSFNNAS